MCLASQAKQWHVERFEVLEDLVLGAEHNQASGQEVVGNMWGQYPLRRVVS